MDYRAALICAVIANVLRSSKRRAFKPEDFMPRYQKQKQTPEEMLAVVKRLHAHFERKKNGD